uniref:BZIP domain-containing protein n=1 Tax=Odontella aurita TaxID=265563 RepID=A0A7S4I3G7_9STRA|mmetsp:Transcript_1932/g.5099  ORF Transcript_1932/g.5099 Transcript_1932/m.5099 type:complete len:975 (+) Transcript_1932:184-3108(+)
MAVMAPTSSSSLSGMSMAFPKDPSGASNGNAYASDTDTGASLAIPGHPMPIPDSAPTPKSGGKGGRGKPSQSVNLTPEERAKLNRDRNREHARSTRLRKKAYISQLKEMLENLHNEKNECEKSRRVAMQHLAEVQTVRRDVVRSFLQFHAGYESDPRKWGTILEAGFFLKQPVTPYRSFRRVEIEQECRKSKGVESMIADAASMSVMVEGMGSRSARWAQIKREDFLSREEARTGGVPVQGAAGSSSRAGASTRRGGRMPHSIVRQNSRLQHAVSSLSSSSGSSTGNGSEEEERQMAQRQVRQSQQSQMRQMQTGAVVARPRSSADKAESGGGGGCGVPQGVGGVVPGAVGNKVSSSSSGSDSRQSSSKQGVGGPPPRMPQHQPHHPSAHAHQAPSSNDFHDYHAPSLPDPMLDSGEGSTGSDSPQESGTSSGADNNRHHGGHRIHRQVVVGTKHVCTDSSSGDDMDTGLGNDKMPATKKRRSNTGGVSSTTFEVPRDTTVTGHASMPGLSSQPPSQANQCRTHGLPPNIARTGGISHSIQPSSAASSSNGAPNGGSAAANARLNSAPAVPLPPFFGIGKRGPTGAVTQASSSAASIPGAATNTSAAAAARAGASTTVVGAATVVSGPRPSHQGTSLAAAASAASNGGGSVSVTGTANAVVVTSGSQGELSSSYATAAKNGNVGSNGGNNPSGNANIAGTRTANGFTHSSSSVLIADNDGTSSSDSSPNSGRPQIRAYYHVNEDDMLLTEDVLMCPFVFRSQDAVQCGALAECVMPGMLRGQFSKRNKLLNVEMVYDAMGFMQQLERASGSEGAAQIVPNSLEMALSPNTDEARVITLAKPPFLIVSVNESWTRMTKYTQMEVEGKEMSILNGKRTDAQAGKRNSKPVHDFAEVSGGRCACSANVHYDKHGRDFVDFVCSYPLTNANDGITHILHVCKELPVPTSPDVEFPDAPSAAGVGIGGGVGGPVSFHGQ